MLRLKLKPKPLRKNGSPSVLVVRTKAGYLQAEHDATVSVSRLTKEGAASKSPQKKPSSSFSPLTIQIGSKSAGTGSLRTLGADWTGQSRRIPRTSPGSQGEIWLFQSGLLKYIVQLPMLIHRIQ